MATEDKLDHVLTSMRNNKVAIKGNSIISNSLKFIFTEYKLSLSYLVLCVYCSGKIHTPMEFKGELASYEMKLR